MRSCEKNQTIQKPVEGSFEFPTDQGCVGAKGNREFQKKPKLRVSVGNVFKIIIDPGPKPRFHKMLLHHDMIRGLFFKPIFMKVVKGLSQEIHVARRRKKNEIIDTMLRTRFIAKTTFTSFPMGPFWTIHIEFLVGKKGIIDFFINREIQPRQKYPIVLKTLLSLIFLLQGQDLFVGIIFRKNSKFLDGILRAKIDLPFKTIAPWLIEINDRFLIVDTPRMDKDIPFDSLFKNIFSKRVKGQTIVNDLTPPIFLGAAHKTT